MSKRSVVTGIVLLIVCVSLADKVNDLKAEGAELMKQKAFEAAAEKFIEATAAQSKAPYRLVGDFEGALHALVRTKKTDRILAADALAVKALSLPGLSYKTRIALEHKRISILAKAGKKADAMALAQDLLNARVDVEGTALAAAEANCVGTVGRAAWYDYLERIIENPKRYGLSGEGLKHFIGAYDGSNTGWGGPVIDRPRLEKAEKYYEKYGFGKITPFRLAEMREMDAFPRPESELNIPRDLRDFGFDPDRKVVHAKDFGWNKDDATECLNRAANSDASTIIVDDMGSPWYVNQVTFEKKTGSNKQIVFRKGVKVHAVTKPVFAQKSIFVLDSASNVVFIGEGELGKDVYIGQFPSREARFASGASYRGSGFQGAGYNVLLRNLWVANNLEDGFCMCGSRHYLVDCILDDNFRQGLSVVHSDHCVYKNVTFCRTVGGEPHNGFDIEPCYESWNCASHYFLNCRFFDNAAGNAVFSTGTYSPTTLCFRDCEFEAGRYRNISVLAHISAYVNPVVEAPSKIVFENCRIDGHSDASTLLWNTMVFNMQFTNCVFNDKGCIDPTRKGNMPPIFLSLDRGYWNGFYPKSGTVRFDDCTFNGWKGRPLIDVADSNGKLGINTFRGVVDHNGTKVDLSKFSYLPPERNLKVAPDPDLSKLDVVAAKSTTASFDFGFSVPWYHPVPTYAYLVRGEKGGKATLKFKGLGTSAMWQLSVRSPSGVERDLGMIKLGDNAVDIAFEETGVHMVCTTYRGNDEQDSTYRFLGAEGSSVSYLAREGKDVGRRLMISTPRDKPRFVGYFEVKGRETFTFKAMGGGLEILDETGKSRLRLEEGDYFCTKCVQLRPEKDAIWTVRALTPSVSFLFFAPQVGLIAETPEALPTTKKGLPFKTVEPAPAPEIRDEPMLPLPEKMSAEVGKLVAERRARAKKGLEAKRLAEAEATLAKLKRNSDGGEGIRGEIEDVTRTVKRLKHHVLGEEQALKESDDEARMAVVVARYGVTLVPEMMWSCSTEDCVFTYPDVRTLRSLYNAVVRRMK